MPLKIQQLNIFFWIKCGVIILVVTIVSQAYLTTICLTICLVIIYTRSPKKIQDPIRKSRPLHLVCCINKFVRAVSLILVREICSLQNPSKSMSKFLETMYNAYYESFPIRKMVIKKHSKPPWLSQDLLYVTKKKPRLYKLLNRGIITRRSSTLYRNILTVLIRKCNQLYYKKNAFIS